MYTDQEYYRSMRQTAQERYRQKYPSLNRPRFDPHNPQVVDTKRLRSHAERDCIRREQSQGLSSELQGLFQSRSPGEDRAPMPNLMKLQLSKYGRHCFDQVDFTVLNQKERAEVKLYNQFLENMYYLEAEHSKINPRRRQLKQYTSFGFSANNHAGRGYDGISSNAGQSNQRAQSPQSTTHVVTESYENPLTSSTKVGGVNKPPFYAQEMLMLFDNNIIKNKKKSIDRVIGPRERTDIYPTIELNQPQVTQIDVSMMNSPVGTQRDHKDVTGYRAVEEDAYFEQQNQVETKLNYYEQKQNSNPFGQFPKTFQNEDSPDLTAVTQRQLNVDMKTTIGADKQIYGGGIITTRDDQMYSRSGSPTALVTHSVKRGSVPERQAILTRSPEVQDRTETDQATAIGYRMTVDEGEIQTGSKDHLQVTLQDGADPLFQSKQQSQNTQGHGSANIPQREDNHNQSGYLQVQRDIHAIEVAGTASGNSPQQQSGTGNLYQQRGRNPKLNQETHMSENLKQTMPVGVVKQENGLATQERITVINNSVPNAMTADGQNQTSKEKSLTSYEGASFAPLNPSDLRENQKIKVAGESPIAFNGAVGLFNTVKIHHSFNQTQKIQSKQKRADAGKNFDLEIHYPQSKESKGKDAEAARGATPGSIDEEKILQEVKLINSGDLVNQKKDQRQQPRDTLKLAPDQLRYNSSESQKYVQLPAPTPSPKKIYKFGHLGGKDDVDNSVYMSQVQRSGHSLHEGKSGAQIIHPAGTTTTAFKLDRFVDKDDKQSEEHQPLTQTILPCMQIKFKPTKDKDDISQSLSRHENTLSAKSKPTKSNLQSLVSTPSKQQREKIAISQGQHDVQSHQTKGKVSIKSQETLGKKSKMKNKKSGKRFEALPVSQVRIKSRALILNQQNHYDDVFERVKTRHEMKIRKLPASYMQQNRNKQTQFRMIQDHTIPTPSGQYSKEKAVDKLKQSFDVGQRLLTDHVSLDPGSDFETQGRSTAAKCEKANKVGRPSILSADATRRGKAKGQKKFYTIHGSPEEMSRKNGSSKQRFSPDVTASQGQGPINKLYVPLNLQTQKISAKNNSDVKGRNISPNSGGELAKDSRNGSSLIPTERSPNNHRNSPDECSRYKQDNIVPAGAAITTIRYKSKGRSLKKNDDTSSKPKIKNQRLCERPKDDVNASKKVTPQVSSAHFTPFYGSGNVSPTGQMEEQEHLCAELREQQELQKQRLLRLSRQYLQRSGGQTFSMSRAGMMKDLKQGNYSRNVVSPKYNRGQGILASANQRSLNLKSLNLKKKLLEGMLIHQQQQQINQLAQEENGYYVSPTNQALQKLGSGDFEGYEEKELLEYAKTKHGGQTIESGNEYKTAPLTILNMRQQVFRGNESGEDLNTEKPNDAQETKRREVASKKALQNESQPELIGGIPIREQIVNIQEKSDNLEPENISFDRPQQLDPYNNSLNQTEKFPANTAMQSIVGRNFPNAIYDTNNLQTTKRQIEENVSEVKSGTISASVLKGPHTATLIENIEKKREQIQIEKNKQVANGKSSQA